MKLLKVIHNNINYEFRLLESVRVIEVIKGGKLTYLIKWATTFFRCNCPSGVYRKYCWHTDMVGLLKKQPSIKEPWAEWAEEAGGMEYG